jgi:hypothetical protein
MGMQGGNDILDGWNGMQCVGNASTPSALACYSRILNDTITMLDALYKLDPVLQVVQFGWVTVTPCSADARLLCVQGAQF